MNRIPNKLIRLWNECIGHSDAFTIESRIFHAVVVIASFILLLNSFVTIALGLSAFVIYSFAFIPVFWVAFYLSRYKNKSNLSIIIFGIAANTDLIATYFFCGGSVGVNTFLVIAITFILAVVCPRRQIKFWVTFNSLLLAALLLAEHLHPEWIVPMYTDNVVQLIDQGQTVIMLIVFITVVTFYIKGNYYKEKHKADLRELELIKSNDAKNKLFSIVAHDLRAPLASVQSYLELLKQVYLTQEEKEQIQNQLLASTRSTSEMLTNILSWTKAQMDGVTLNFLTFNLQRVLQNTIQVQYHLAREKGIELNYQDRSEITLFADPDMMQLIVRNLLNNAIKFTPAGGKISVLYEAKGEECMIIIKDDGIGIAKEKQKEIFSLKSQSTFGTNNEKGVGLGLVLARSYVELQNGKIWFDSEEGKGTTFYLSFGIHEKLLTH